MSETKLYGIRTNGEIRQSESNVYRQRLNEYMLSPGEECVEVEIVAAGELQRQEDRVMAWQREGARQAEEAKRLRELLHGVAQRLDEALVIAELETAANLYDNMCEREWAHQSRASAELVRALLSDLRSGALDGKGED